MMIRDHWNPRPFPSWVTSGPSLDHPELFADFAKEVAGKGVTVNSVAPGYTQTSMTEKLTEAQRDAVIQQIPIRRLGTVEDIAEMVLFLASEKARYITGQVISVDGGMNI